MATATETGTTTPPATGTPPPPATPPAAPPPAATSTEDDDFPEGLGDAGKRALRKERERAAAAERERDRLAAERDELKTKTQTDHEREVEKARKEGEAAALLKANQRIVRSEIRAAASVLADPDDAVGMLGDLDRFIVKDEVDSKAIKAAIAELVKAKPYLAAAGTRAKPLPGGSATQTSGSSFNDDLRRRMLRGKG